MTRFNGERPYEVKGGYIQDEKWGAGFWTANGFYIFLPKVNGKTTDECLIEAVSLAEYVRSSPAPGEQ